MRPLLAAVLSVACVGAASAADRDPAPADDGAVMGGRSGGMMPASHYDTDRDGRIDRAEIAAIADRAARDSVLRFDRDGDGMVDEAEGRRAEADEAVDGLLSQFDANRDGRLERSELQKIADQQVQEFLDTHDGDSDGALSRSELTGAPDADAAGEAPAAQ